MIRRGAVAAAAAAAGAAVAVGLTFLLADGYRSTATLLVLPAAEDSISPAGTAGAEGQAASYAALVERTGFLEQVRPQVRAGRFTARELAGRVEGRNPAGTALVDIVASGDTPEEARGLAADLAAALLGSARQSARQRAAQIEDELRRRLEDLDSAIRDAGEDAAPEGLEQQRAALNDQLAAAAAGAVRDGTRLEPAAPAGEAERDRPPLWLAALVGAGAGLVLGSVAPLPRRRVPRPAAVVAPAAGAVVSGEVPVVTDPAGAPVETSRDGAAWSAVDGTWDTRLVPDGRYLLRPAGSAGSAEVVPLEVDNGPPRVRLEDPAPEGGRFRLRAAAEDAGSGVGSVRFMASDGSPEWTEIPADWEPPAPGVWWLCAVATDRAGNEAASALVPVRVESL